MALTAFYDKIKPGFLVYEAFYPQNPGKIRQIVSDGMITHRSNPQHQFRIMKVEVEWLKETKKRPKIQIVSTLGLMDFEALIEDHRRKYENQTKLADQLRNM